MGHACTPFGAVSCHSSTGSLHDNMVTLDDVVEVGIIVSDRRKDRRKLCEEFLDLCATVGDSPLGEAYLSIVSEQIKKVFASIQPFEIFERYGFALLVSHRLLCHAHCFTSNSVLCRSILIQMQMPRFSASISSRSEEHTSELQSRQYLVCRLLLEKKKIKTSPYL